MTNRVLNTAQGQLKREDNFRQAKASVRLEGGVPSPQLESLGRLYVEGTISIQEFVQQGLAIAEANHREHQSQADQ